TSRRARLREDAAYVEHAGLAVERRLDAADQPVAAQDRQHVVAVLALRLRHVHLEAVEEVPERLRPATVLDEAVEGGEERDPARGHRAVADVRVRDELTARQP